MLHNIYSNHYYQVPNPTAPYHDEIPYGLVPGKQIYISGVVPPDADRFRFDLMSPSGAVVFVINPRFHANAIIRNTDPVGNDGGWGPEEREGPMVFQQGYPYELVINVEHDRYVVFVNNVHVFDYHHRMPLHEAVALDISGEIEVHRIVYSNTSGQRGPETHQPPVPFSTHLVHGCVPGRLIQISGQVHPECGRFEVDLQGGPGEQPDNIGLCFNVRFDDPYSGEAVVRVNRRGGEWGPEEREVPHFPFYRGSHFELLILIEEHEIKVAVNGQHFISFSHKAPLYEIDHIGVAGDVHINYVKQF